MRAIPGGKLEIIKGTFPNVGEATNEQAWREEGHEG
jgi:hypothetical protein